MDSIIRAILRTPIGVFASVVFLAAVAAIVFERAINDLFLDHLNPWSVMGVAVLIVAFTPVIVRLHPPNPRFWIIAGLGALLFYHGYNLGA